jgi:hypothetical protein
VAFTLLLKTVSEDTTEAGCAATFAALARTLEPHVRTLSWKVYRGLRTPDVYAYGSAIQGAVIGADVLSRCKAFGNDCGGAPAATLDWLNPKARFAGASHGPRAEAHYVVETDSTTGWDEELFRWYDVEHMPALAAVVGCTCARRFINEGRGPRSFACYDLVAPEIITTERWLAVRQTAWSDRVRAHFRNTRRTLFRPLMIDR